MIQPDTITAAIRLVRAEEAWEPVLLGGMIPVLGAGAVFWLIRWAVKEPPEENVDNPHEEKGDGPGDPDPPPR